MKKRARIARLGILFAIVLLLVVAFADVSAAQFSRVSGGFGGYSAQYYRPSFSYYTGDQIRTYWAEFGKEQCEARQDFILNIRPGSCQPSVVRSDLLEEQNVPVFCKIDAIKINPLIDVEAIRSISFRGNYPESVAGVGFHPARAAIRSYNTLLGSPLMNNIGYLVVVLRRQKSEAEMPDFVEGNLTALIRYDIEKAFGVGKAEYLLPVLTESEWSRDYLEYGFWRGKGFLRANWIEKDRASISIYRDSIHKETTATLRKGQTSGNIYLGGFYCKAALNIHLKDIVAPETMAKIIITKEGSEDSLWLYEKSSFLDGKCRIMDINALAFGEGSVTIRSVSYTHLTLPTN